MTRTKESLWKSVVSQVKSGDKGGNPGQWSARKAQLAVSIYKKKGGGYSGAKTSSNKLSKWTKEDWGTKSGKPSGKTGERYLPKKAIKALTPKEYAATTKAKRKGTEEGKQFVKQPKAIAKKVKPFRN